MKTHLGDPCSMYYYGFMFLEIFFMNCAYEILSSLNIVRLWCNSSFNIHKKQKRDWKLLLFIARDEVFHDINEVKAILDSHFYLRIDNTWSLWLHQ